MRVALPSALALLLSAAAPAAVPPGRVAAPPRTPPAASCLDARRVAEVVQADVHTLGVRLDDDSNFRIDLARRCPGVAAAPGVRLVSPGGWVCGRGGDETVQLGALRCPVANVARIDAKAFSTLALQGTRDPDARVLERVEVKGERRRGFAGSPAYCFNTNHLRSWHEDGDGIVVEVSPRRSAGHRYYRVELGASCQGLTDAGHLSFVSGVGGAMICGYAGDRAVFRSDLDVNGMAGVFEGPIGDRSRVGRGVPGAPTMLALGEGCPVAQVYPIDDRRVADR